MPDLNDVLKPLRDAAAVIERNVDELYSEGGEFVAGAFIAGARHALTEPIILRTPEELDALPMGAVVGELDDGDVFVKVKDAAWHHLGGVNLFPPGALIMMHPVELIRLPREDA
ncbi:hypothetical protein [Nesterenkonia sp. K-15-9-6]|uniref:hypothetical protein n=1 Tax=Nesterenkonia sp. K-15-9-6 TaxID=3093918 RepID=UPI0040445E9E